MSVTAQGVRVRATPAPERSWQGEEVLAAIVGIGPYADHFEVDQLDAKLEAYSTARSAEGPALVAWLKGNDLYDELAARSELFRKQLEHYAAGGYAGLVMVDSLLNAVGLHPHALPAAVWSDRARAPRRPRQTTHLSLSNSTACERQAA